MAIAHTAIAGTDPSAVVVGTSHTVAVRDNPSVAEEGIVADIPALEATARSPFAAACHIPWASHRNPCPLAAEVTTGPR